MAGANQLLTISMITRRALPILANTLVLADKINRSYDDEFARKGYKIGGTANIRLPARFRGTFGPALSVEPITENYRQVSIRYQLHVDMQWTMAQQTLDMDDFEDRYLKPAVTTIANRMDSDVGYYYLYNVANRLGTPGVTPSAFRPFSDARAILISEGMPKGEVPSSVLHPFAQSSMSDVLKSLYNPQVRISEIYETGMVAGKTAGADWFEDPNIGSYLTGQLLGTPVLAGVTTAAGGTFIVTSGWAANGFMNLSGLTASTAAVNVGDTLQVAGLFPANPQNRRQYSNTLKQFVVVPPGGYAQMSGPAISTTPQFAPATLTNGTFNETTGTYTASSGGLLSVLVAEPAIIGGQFQNTVASAAFTGTPVVTLNGGVAVNTNSTENAYFHRDALCMAVVDLDIPPEGAGAKASSAADKDLGLAIRVLRAYTVNNDATVLRADVAYGIDPLYPELGVRISG